MLSYHIFLIIASILFLLYGVIVISLIVSELLVPKIDYTDDENGYF